MNWWGFLASVSLVLGIVLSPAGASATPSALFAYGATAEPSTTTTWIAEAPSGQGERSGVGGQVYGEPLRVHDGWSTNVRTATRAARAQVYGDDLDAEGGGRRLRI